ncbi:helix-turn-helix domain-containing protein [Nannocystis punicea]|uniref:Helix-turn-helix domain-containing protein n=1 Tax=Nannocystis punicea TaxID=2995304 RepID=A0ABY7GU90_9BACT|nr:helix-turn-helix domain-containing protein [Nannocystis poenicansa]WAS90537.1 helix-turn-helix domain-containing protein [Nannocystis poenicansa]
MSEGVFVTTAQVCEAAGISPATAHRWSKAGLLPPYERIHRGRHGQLARWPAHAVEQARWVKRKLSELFSFDEIRALLEAGEFDKSHT